MCVNHARAAYIRTDADDLAFLAVWKRAVAKRNQATSEAEGLRQAAQCLKRSLLTSEEEARQLRGRLDEEAAVRADVEQQLQELQAKHSKLEVQYREQNQVRTTATRSCH
jgi:chromosome segregation ATPase